MLLDFAVKSTVGHTCHASASWKDVDSTASRVETEGPAEAHQSASEKQIETTTNDVNKAKDFLSDPVTRASSLWSRPHWHPPCSSKATPPERCHLSELHSQGSSRSLMFLRPLSCGNLATTKPAGSVNGSTSVEKLGTTLYVASTPVPARY